MDGSLQASQSISQMRGEAVASLETTVEQLREALSAVKQERSELRKQLASKQRLCDHQDVVIGRQQSLGMRAMAGGLVRNALSRGLTSALSRRRVASMKRTSAVQAFGFASRIARLNEELQELRDHAEVDEELKALELEHRMETELDERVGKEVERRMSSLPFDLVGGAAGAGMLTGALKGLAEEEEEQDNNDDDDDDDDGDLGTGSRKKDAAPPKKTYLELLEESASAPGASLSPNAGSAAETLKTPPPPKGVRGSRSKQQHGSKPRASGSRIKHQPRGSPKGMLYDLSSSPSTPSTASTSSPHGTTRRRQSAHPTRPSLSSAAGRRAPHGIGGSSGSSGNNSKTAVPASSPSLAGTGKHTRRVRASVHGGNAGAAAGADLTSPTGINDLLRGRLKDQQKSIERRKHRTSKQGGWL